MVDVDTVVLREVCGPSLTVYIGPYKPGGFIGESYNEGADFFIGGHGLFQSVRVIVSVYLVPDTFTEDLAESGETFIILGGTDAGAIRVRG